MVFETSVHAQDTSEGFVGVVLDALEDASRQAKSYGLVKVAVAYASVRGVELLNQRLAGTVWQRSRKQFLISIDFGFTDPEALVALSKLSNSEVRVPNADEVLSSPRLTPPFAFHSKMFLFQDATTSEVRSSVVGSANLTASALSTGAEVVVKQIRQNAVVDTSTEVVHEQALTWFETAWKRADTLDRFIDNYRLRRKTPPEQSHPVEDETAASGQYTSSSVDNVVSGELLVQLTHARSLWVNASSMIHNRGTYPGNQLNTPRGTRAFFGFSTSHVPTNTTLGMVDIRVSGYDYWERSVRFSDNSMDVVTLPIPEDNGVATYEGNYLIFTREPSQPSGIPRFTLSVADLEGLERRKAQSSNCVDLAMKTGRTYGLLF